MINVLHKCLGSEWHLMKYWMRYFILFLLASFSTTGVCQTDSSPFKLACNECESLLDKKKLDKALVCFERVAVDYPLEIRPLIRLAEIYFEKRDFTHSIHFANSAIALNPNKAFDPLLTLAGKMKSKDYFDEAQRIINRLAVQEFDTTFNSQALLKVQKLQTQSIVVRQKRNDIVMNNMGDSINTIYDEYLPTLRLDNSMLVFTRKIDGNEDFFVSYKDSNGMWQKAKNMGYPPNTSAPDGGAMLSADGNYLFYTRCDMRSPNGIEGGGCDLAFSYREDSVWSSPQYFGYTINTSAYEGQASLSSDNKDLYFVSNREGGFGGMDIWVSRFENNFWSKPINLGPSINTPGNEISPFIHPDNETLYFASDGHPGLGLSDVFVSKKNKNGTWKKPLHLPAPINSEAFEGAIIVEARGKYGYLASQRSDSRGHNDLYRFSLSSDIAPIPTLCVHGYVYDKYFKSKLPNRQIDFYNSQGQYLTSIQSNEGDASYTHALQMGKSYKIKVTELGYRTYTKTVNLYSDTLPDIVHLDIKLRQPGYRDTLFAISFLVDTINLIQDSSLAYSLDSVVNVWSQAKNDSADLQLFLTSYYYCCDSVADSLYLDRLQHCLQKLNTLIKALEKRGIPCEHIMPITEMLIYRDDDFVSEQNVKMSLVEYY